MTTYTERAQKQIEQIKEIYAPLGGYQVDTGVDRTIYMCVLRFCGLV